MEDTIVTADKVQVKQEGFTCVMCKRFFFGFPRRSNAAGEFCSECNASIAEKIKEGHARNKAGRPRKTASTKIDYISVAKDLCAAGWLTEGEAGDALAIGNGGNRKKLIEAMGIPVVTMPCGEKRTRALYHGPSVKLLVEAANKKEKNKEKVEALKKDVDALKAMLNQAMKTIEELS
jgi:hypothetical protein